MASETTTVSDSMKAQPKSQRTKTLRILAPQGKLPQGKSVEGELQLDLKAEGVVFWTVALHALWWILGIQVFVYPAVGWYLFYRSFNRPARVPLPFGWQMWLVYIGVWICSLIVSLAIGTAEVGRSITTTGSILGVWMLIPIVWYAVRRLGVRYQVVVRAVCWLGVCQLIAVIIGQAHLELTGSIVKTQSLITSVVPSLPAEIFFHANLYSFDKLDWQTRIPRLVSFYYWSPLAGTMSMIVSMVTLAERNHFWRGLGLLGALATLWYAASRSGQVGVAVAAFVTLWFGSQLGRKLVLWSLIPLSFMSPVILQRLHNYFFVYRRDSATAREELHAESLQAFLKSPILGYGAQGRSNVLDLPLGSHSQFYSTIYHTGVIGAAVLIVAWIAVTVALVRLVLKRPALAPTLGAWVGLTFTMVSGELAAASITVFVLAAWFGCAWNWDQQLTIKAQRPWVPDLPSLEPATPWQSLSHWWQGTGPSRR